MTKFILLSFLTSLLIFSSCDAKTIIPSSTIQTKEVQSTKIFDKLEVKGSINVIYTTGNPKIRIVAPDNIMPLINTKVENGKAIVSLDEHIFISFKNVDIPKAYISSPSLNNINITGSGDVILNSDIVSVSDFNALITGSGEIKSKDITCTNNFKCGIVGSGEIKIYGSVYSSNTDLSINGSGDIKVSSIVSPKINTGITGSGDIEIDNSRSNDLSSNITGSGEIELINTKTTNLKASVQGTGEIEVAGTAENAIYDVASSGEIKAYKLIANNATAHLLGSGKISCNAQRNLSSNIKGSGNVYYVGNPKISNKNDNNTPRPMYK